MVRKLTEESLPNRFKTPEAHEEFIRGRGDVYGAQKYRLLQLWWHLEVEKESWW